MKSLCTLAVALALTGTAHALTPYSLANDFSDIDNPNGVWSFMQGSTALTHHSPLEGNGNTLNPAVANGFWGTGDDLNTDVPFVAKTVLNGANVIGYGNQDFVLGDVIAHSPNAGESLFINWTAPATGTISYNASAWYAHSGVLRANEVLVTLDGTSQGVASLINEVNDRDAPMPLWGTSLAVAAGDVLSFEIRKEASQQFGSITGLNVAVDFTAAPVPEPAAYGLMMLGLGAVGAAARRRAGAARG